MAAAITHVARLFGILVLMSLPALATLVFDGGSGAVSMGVGPYGGAPNVGGPTYIADNVTGLDGILSSPGLGTLGGYLTASPIVANNIES